MTEAARTDGALELGVRADPRTESRHWLIVALLAGLWSAGWTWVLLASMRASPGVISDRPGRGAFDLVEVPLGRPYGVALLALFLSAGLLILLPGLFRNLLDPARRAIDALLWPLRSRGFVLACAFWMAAGVIAAFRMRDMSWLEWSAIALLAAGWLLMPFACWNPAMLAAARPLRWWRPRWPGSGAVVFAALMLAASLLLQFCADALAGTGGLGRTALAWLLGDMLAVLCLAMAAVVWLDRGRWRSTAAHVRRLPGGRFVGESIWLYAALWVVGLVVAVPVLVAALLVVFALPQFELHAQAGGQPVPALLRGVAGFFRHGLGLQLAAEVPMGWYFGLVLGRLLRSHGIGAGQAPGTWESVGRVAHPAG